MMEEEAFDDLWEQLIELGLQEKVFKDVLRHTCSLELAAIKIPIMFSKDDEQFRCYITLKRHETGYELYEMDAFVRRNLSIEHMQWGKDNTADLEKRMKSIDWDVDYTSDQFREACIKNNSLALLQNKIFSVFHDVMMLMRSGNTRAMGIGLQLQQRYWYSQQFGLDMGLHDSQSSLSRLSFYTFDLTKTRFTIEQVHGMLNFNPVAIVRDTVPDGTQRIWYALAHHNADNPVNPRLESYPDFDLEKLVDSVPLPVVQKFRDHSLNKLMNGHPVKLFDMQGEICFRLDIYRQQLIFYDPLMLPVSLEQVMEARVEKNKVAHEQQRTPPNKLTRSGSRSKKRFKGRGGNTPT